jgi:hypothetical protein
MEAARKVGFKCRNGGRGKDCCGGKTNDYLMESSSIAIHITILVIMEFGSRPLRILTDSFSLISLNPCCNGI